MSAQVVSIFCLVFLAQAFAMRDMSKSASRGLLQSSATTTTGVELVSTEGGSVTARATAQAFSAGGTVSAHVTATGEAITEVTDAFAVAVAEAVANVEGGGDAEAIANATAEAYAEAVASAYAEVIVDISSDAESGAACASGFSDAEATATAFARALVEVYASASNSIAFSDAAGTAAAVSAATANAFATAEANACGEGVFNAQLEAFTLSEAIVRPYVIVSGAAFAAVAEGAAAATIDLSASSFVDEETFSEGESGGTATGDVTGGAATDGGATTTPATNFCDSNIFGSCCGARRRPRRTCSCGFGCFASLDESLGATDTAFGYVVTRSRSETGPQQGDSCICP